MTNSVSPGVPIDSSNVAGMSPSGWPKAIVAMLKIWAPTNWYMTSKVLPTSRPCVIVRLSIGPWLWTVATNFTTPLAMSVTVDALKTRSNSPTVYPFLTSRPRHVPTMMDGGPGCGVTWQYAAQRSFEPPLLSGIHVFVTLSQR